MSTATLAPNAGADTNAAVTAASQPAGGSQPAATPHQDAYDKILNQPETTPAAGQPETGEQGTSAAVAQPEAAPGEKDAPPAKEAEGEKVPWNNDPRFKQFLAERKDVAELREIVTTVAEARQLVEQVEQSRQIQQDYEGLQTQFREDPIGLATDWKAKSPESFGQLVTDLHPGMLADFYDFAARSQAAPETLTEIQRIAQQFLDQGSRTPEAGRKDAKAERLEAELKARDKREFQRQHQDFQAKVEDAYKSAMQKEFDKITEGIAFPTSDLKDVAFERALQEVQRICENDQAFVSRVKAMTGRAKLNDPEAVKAVTAAILNRARVNGLWATTVGGLLKKFGAAEKSAAPATTEKQKADTAAAKRTEVNGSGAAANGANTPEAIRLRMDEARKQGKDPYDAALGL